MIEIAILDPHPVVRAGLRRLVAEHTDLRIVGEARLPADAMERVTGTMPPDVLILDLPAPGQLGFDTLASLHVAAPKVSILLFTAHPAEHYALESLRQGARGYLNKNCAPSEHIMAVRTLAMGRRYFSAEVTELLPTQLHRGRGCAAHEQLSEREFQVFCQLAKGETASTIAMGLALSVKTVSTYRTRLMEKLNLSTNSDLTYYAINNRLIA